MSQETSTSNNSNSASEVDPELVRRFALFRDAQPAISTPIDERDSNAIQQLVSGPAGERFGLNADDAKKVIVNETIAALVIPGKDGVSVIVRGPRDGFNALWAPTKSVLAGDPIGSIGATLIGMAPDGVAAQPVALAGDTIVSAEVVHNVYAINDPARET